MSLKEIAAMTGTSVSTVSRVLSGKNPKCASQPVADRIRAAARELGYVPNPHAQALKTGKGDAPAPWLVAVVVFRLSSLAEDPFFEELYRCVETELLARSCQVRLLTQPDSAALDTLSAADGVVLLGRCDQSRIAAVRERNRNLVGLWRNPMEGALDQVFCSGEKAAQTAVDYLISLGHRDIAYIGDGSAEGRFVGYTHALLAHQIPIRLPLVYETDQTREEGRSAMERLLEAGQATAVLCANDWTALGVLEALKAHRGRKTPPVSVVSIDNISAAARSVPMLTTMNVPRQDMAHLAVTLLLDRLERGHSEYLSLELPARLMERDSCYVNIPSQ
ncbi:MAG: LacI family transcriptional regulator [Oscillospiraceae bacterium]|nr:LacI family transcriptional regulator [Oscillospiraceae bacterium]